VGRAISIELSHHRILLLHSRAGIILRRVSRPCGPPLATCASKVRKGGHPVTCRKHRDLLRWETVRDEFAFDGSWRDICVFQTAIADWQRMLDALRSAGYRLEYFRADQPAELPAKAAETFPLSDECDRRLSVWFADVLANCHFFTVEQIEFDIDPREIKGQRELDALFDFMRCLADAANKEAVLRSRE
jgi:hypothetical protein